MMRLERGQRGLFPDELGVAPWCRGRGQDPGELD
jgi:hypothetical protein